MTDEASPMASLRMEWTATSKAQFDELRTRATSKGEYGQFAEAHNQIAVALRDPDQALEKGELLYKTRRPGGEVRHWVHRFISVCYVVFRAEQVGWILSIKSVPESWPD
jgi:hypothetical protein